MIERSIGNYKILEHLSRTEDFDVYKAVDLPLDRSVVVKFLSRPEIAENFRAEAATLAKLEHKCVPALYSLTAIDDELFMISEYSEGETLDRVLFREGNFSIEKAVSIFAQIFDCVEYTHKNNVAHGCFKTSDVILTDAGNIKITNYGAMQTSDKQSDISALALMLYKSLTGKTEFDAEEKSERKIAETLESVIKKAASENSAEKFKNIAEFRAALVAAGFVNTDDAKKSARNFSVKNPNGKFSATRAASFSKRENRSSPKEISLKPIQPDIFDNKKPNSSPEKSKQKSYKYKVAGAAIFAVLVLHLVWQFSFVRNENLRDAEIAFKTIQPAAPLNEPKIIEPSVEPNVVSQPDEIKTDLKAKNSAVVNSEKTVQKTNYGRSEIKSETPAPSKKKAMRESKNERLRRAEKLLTGM